MADLSTTRRNLLSRGTAAIGAFALLGNDAVMNLYAKTLGASFAFDWGPALTAPINEELAKGGALLDATGLHPSSKGFRVKYDGSKRTVIDGPFTETKELIAGYTLIQVKTREEAVEWAKRFPNPHGEGSNSEIEVRQLFELEDFAPGDAVDRFRDMGLDSNR
jgi:hypothetical protein